MKVAAGTYWHLIGDAFAPILERQSNVMHACEAETSMMLALRPDSVRRERLPEAHGPASTRVEGQPPTLALRRPPPPSCRPPPPPPPPAGACPRRTAPPRRAWKASPRR